MDATNTILQVEGLETQFRTEEGLVKAVDGVSFGLHRGETLGLVGESGSRQVGDEPLDPAALSRSPRQDRRRQGPLPRPRPPQGFGGGGAGRCGAGTSP